MQRYLKFVSIISSAIILYLSLGCGYLKKEGEDAYEPFYDSDHYMPGDSINALGYEDGQQIDVYLTGQTKSTDIRPLSDGDYVKPNVQIPVYIETATRFKGKDPMDQRVYISDGGNHFSVEAFLDEASGFYTCEYTFDDSFLIYPLLIQVIYPDNQASKKKLLLRTRENPLKPSSDKLVKNGLGITLGQNALDSLKAQFQNMVPGSLKLTKLKPSTSDGYIFYLELGSLIGANLNLNDTYIKDDEETRGLSMELDLTSRVQNQSAYAQMMNWLIDLLDPIIDSAGLSDQVIGPVSFSLSDMLADLAKNNDDTGAESDASENAFLNLLENLTLDSQLFLNIFGLPEDTDADFAAVGAGLYATDTKNLAIDPETEKPVWPDVQVDNTDTNIDMSKIKTGTTDLGIGISQYNLNQVISSMMNSFRIVLGPDRIATLKDYIATENPDDVMTLALTLNPEGIAVDFTQPDLVSANTALIAVNDIHAEILENEIAKALLSIDITLKVDSSFSIEDGNLYLDLEIKPLEDLCHIHLMKDNKGIGIVDHRSLVTKLFQEIAGCEPDKPLKVSISLSDLGIMPSLSKGAGNINFDGKGNCFMNLAVESIDASRFCFISSL
ncbi:MAG: hypothetical protein KJ737_11450 [Proteobacteria bacterium]|nr:hypothetical protein [Pseudomonadota bacterium]